MKYKTQTPQVFHHLAFLSIYEWIQYLHNNATHPPTHHLGFVPNHKNINALAVKAKQESPLAYSAKCDIDVEACPTLAKVVPLASFLTYQCYLNHSDETHVLTLHQAPDVIFLILDLVNDIFINSLLYMYFVHRSQALLTRPSWFLFRVGTNFVVAIHLCCRPPYCIHQLHFTSGEARHKTCLST